MAYQVLARKWRPKQFKDVLGQDHIIRTLVNSIKSNKVAHAYLLTGTRGVGKTTIARIFAKAIRCESLTVENEPCLVCDSCLAIEQTNSLDYLEIDGASNNSVDDIRELIENVQYLPTSGKYKVYVIDEVHMLSVSAFNALLKTLEEPPEHVVFIFATTDPQKLLGTVLSRCQRFDFKNVDVDTLSAHIKNIALKENINFENENLVKELAKQGHGSVRDMLSLFDQVISLSEGETVTEKSMLLSLGLANTRSVNSLLISIFAKDKENTILSFNSIIDENIDLKTFTLQFLDRLFFILKNISPSGDLYDNELDDQVLKDLSYIEIMWIYENLMKDFEWALGSLSPEKACLFSLLKVVAREEILSKSSTPIQIKKKLNNPPEIQVQSMPVVPLVLKQEVKLSPVSEEALIETPTPKKNTPKLWPEFIKFLFETYKGLAVNVERGNLLGENEILNEQNVRVGFTAECKIFFDYLNEYENTKLFIQALAEFMNVEYNQVNLSLEILNEKEVKVNQFESSVDIIQREASELKKERENKILNNKYIQDAQELFNSKIEKIVLNDRE